MVVGAGLAALLSASLVTAFTPLSPAQAAPSNPTDGQISRAAKAKAQAAADVGRLSGLIAAIESQIVQLNDKAELAKDHYLKAIWDLAEAKKAAVTARANVTAAQQKVDAARDQFRLFIQASYENHGSDMSGLLTASNPSELLAQADLSHYTSSRKINAIGDLNRATVGKANADAAARSAVAKQTSLTNAAAAAQQAAVQAVAQAQQQQQSLTSQKATYESQLTAAGEALTGLQNKRAAFLAWQKAEAKRRAAEARRRQLAAERAREREQQQQQQQQNTGGGGGGGGGTVTQSGSWTAAKGRAAAHRALQWLGERYSFAAGNYSGPTWGACVTNDAGWNDCHVFGFDCSGLAMYAWAPAGIYMPHYAASQYYYGSFHPSVDQLMPGDLVFWSSDGTVPGIHHVAIYIGGGNVVQAPQSGDVVKITPLQDVDWGYYGATRPGS